MNDKISNVLFDQINIPTSLLYHYKDLGLDEKQVMLLVQIYISQKNTIYFPTPEQLAQHVTMSMEECSGLLRQLIQQGFLKIEEEENDDVIKEIYSLEPLWNKLFVENDGKEDKEDKQVGEMFLRFEREFGRPLSPFEIERVNQWLDGEQHSIELIYAALREAVLMSKLNFNYIDRILFDWKKKGIQSPVQARESSKAFHGKKIDNKGNNTNSSKKSLYYNWLED
ncbi:DnaD domain-containing protein [Gracilibacillus dipsosauri]|uniref:DNA replication protein DnaD n=1 Tax=Gracilibacillus dipsosauri TaxID=178340 RepID=A0A317L0V4_9BACI|nr:DnaD domain-containing protein [Gracilibacillus dipsosauri]PWU68670.1 DNA replication protein DnaD [Gracilibacillus dipsosauri]